MTEMPLAARDRRATAASAARALAGALVALTFALAFAVLASSLTGCASEEPPAGKEKAAASSEASADVIVVASALNSEPYEQATSTNQIGFTVELLRLIGERAGLEVQFSKAVNHKDADQNITAGLPEDVAAKVTEGEANLGASSITAEEALAGVVFTDPYLHADYAVLTKMDTGYDDLASIQGEGVIVAVQNDPAIAVWVSDNLPAAEVVTFDAGVDALMELNSERAQAAIVDEPRFRRYTKVKEPHLQAVETIASDKDYAFIVAEGNGELLGKVNDALAALKADGSYDELYESWFGDAPEGGTATRSAAESVQDSTGA
ncbi:transporter substrate-binding domain-containing protein [Adlercreutzia sp. R25]|uniref:Transporter substrate-binding domain-containing protein n=1 Tax=Adlercreutzia shanghongiae TaxID=3111773 RepID=A0ABU6IXX5_9ACTN|nr:MULTISPECIES: transporter substrate-binding domain-containing protein [unclassified Adlercreutzia]MEC4271668.1 transporter substrate-binding domain-containing protein [Adlercreutzia sp. R25]MEC4294674.1 transporter substrate-binding domain-containing protein [Adlercreutzia sp. R22]